MPSTFVDHLIPAITWTLVHSLWQGLILTVLAGFVMLFTRRSTAALRYALLCTLFFLFLGGVCITFLVEWSQEIEPLVSSSILQEQSSSSSIFSIDQLQKSFTSFLDQNAQWIVLAWSVILLFQSGRIIRQMAYIQKLRNNKAWNSDLLWKNKLQSLAEEIGIRKTVSLVESALIKVPIVIGHFKPIVMVPIGMLNQLTPGEAEAVLLHELAHIRRHDYLVNYLQRIAETVLFFNPGLLWVSSLLRAEREVCCDEMAISRTGNKLQFVEALIRCKEQTMHSPAFSLGLFGNRNLLLQRMNRIVSNRNKSMSFFEVSFFTISLLVLGLVLSGWNAQTDRLTTVASATALIKDQADKEIISQIVEKEKEPKKENKQLAINTKPASSRSETIRLTQNRKQPVRKIIADIKQPDQSVTQSTKELSQEIAQPIESDAKILANTGRTEVAQRRVMIDQNRLQLEKAHQQMQIDRTKAELHRKHAERERSLANERRLLAEQDRLRADKERRQAQKFREENNYRRRIQILQ